MSVKFGEGASQEGFDPTKLMTPLAEATKKVKEKLDVMNKQDEVSIVDMFEMQMLMNSLSQMSEMSTSVMSAANSAISSMARKVSS